MRREAETQNSDILPGYSRVVLLIIVTRSRDLGLGPLCSQTSMWWKRSSRIALSLVSPRLEGAPHSLTQA